MSLKLSLADAGDVKIGGFVQAFVCFSWSSAFQGFCESCRLTRKYIFEFNATLDLNAI